STCDHIQSQLLEHLYGLLDTEQSRALDEHVSQCAACQAALSQAERQRQLLAAAARGNFAGVSFRAPVAGLPRDEEATVPLTPAPPRRRTWVRWAVAASVVLVLGGVGIPGAVYWKQSQVVAQADRDVKRTETDERVARTDLQQHQAKADRELASIRDEHQ